ncbi:MAG: prepilin-type N-terminal cleavage/methylation domain-containing protein [Lachnospiraceae bacterium]|nr:prepilin-type N-terminal cleavage/methylation domain-containing protein [Lachnospiraceae bacterium]
MKKRLEELRKDQKGFTLVELIVVLVILAILAALLVPALLGYIDRARSSKYLEEARSIYTAIQAVNDEKYAKAEAPLGQLETFATDHSVNKLVTPTVCKKAYITSKSNAYTSGDKNNYVVQSLDLYFQSQDNKFIVIKMTNGDWNTDDVGVFDAESAVELPSTLSASSGS